MNADDEFRAAIVTVRNAYGKLLAWLAWRWRDISEAEEALSDALLAAVETWPVAGIPHNPEGWIMAVARNAMLDRARRKRMRQDAAADILLAVDEEAQMAFSIPDERLRLMLVCAHPAIDSSIHIALMLQCVLGLNADRIARLFLVSPEAMAKRLVRAKAKIRQSGIAFEIGDASDLRVRLDAVLEAVYACYSADAVYDGAGSEQQDNALHLGRIVADLAADDGEALGLLALMLYCEARKAAQFRPDGELVPLDLQDTRRWSQALIDEADRLLTRAAGLGSVGPFQLEAAIQSAHCSRRHGAETPWPDIARLYEALLAFAPTIGAEIGRALALARATDRPEDGLRLLDALDAARVDAYQPWWAARAYLFERAGREDEAVACLQRAIALTRDIRVVAHFEARLRRLRPIQ